MIRWGFFQKYSKHNIIFNTFDTVKIACTYSDWLKHYLALVYLHVYFWFADNNEGSLSISNYQWNKQAVKKC